MDKNELLTKILAVCRVPNFQKVFERKVLELIEYMKLNPDDYHDVLQQLEPGPPENFQLKKQGKTWIHPPGIPRQVVDHILDNASPGLIAMPLDFTINGRLSRVTFEMQNEDSITGTISREGKQKNPGSPVSIKAANQLDETEQELLHYMRTHDAFRNHLLSELNIRWKPFLDRQNKRKSS